MRRKVASPMAVSRRYWGALSHGQQFSTDELMQLIEYQLYLDHPELNRTIGNGWLVYSVLTHRCGTT